MEGEGLTDERLDKLRSEIREMRYNHGLASPICMVALALLEVADALRDKQEPKA